MTTLITRLYADKDTASQASKALIARGFEKNSIQTLDGCAGLADMGVDSAVTDAYSAAMGDGNAVLALKAPFGSVGMAVSTLGDFDPIEVDAAQELYIAPKTNPEIMLSIIPGNKKFLTARSEVGHSTITGERRNLLSSNQKGRADTYHGTKMGSRKSQLSRNQKGRSKPKHYTVMGKRSSLVKKPRAGTSLISDPTPFSSFFGWSTIIRD